MTDRVKIQIQFRKAIWICPNCKQEDYEDFNVAGGNTYEHNCSVCDQWFNFFKEYNGTLNYTLNEYPLIKEEDKALAKQILVDEWLYVVKNPPPYIKPTLEDLLKMREDKIKEADELTEQIALKDTTDKTKINENIVIEADKIKAGSIDTTISDIVKKDK